MSLQDSKFIFKNANAKILSISLTGNLDTLKIQNLKKEDSYIVNDNYTVIVKDKKLTFSSNLDKFEYKFKSSSLSRPRLHLKNDKLIISIRDIKENLIYLFNKKGHLITQPFFGTTDYHLNMNEYTNNLIVGSYEGLIYNYEFND